MTKLLEWLSVLGCLCVLWLSLLSNKIQSEFVQENHTLILWSPLIFALLFGIYAATVILYRVFTFNNCEKAALELQKDIEDAKKDLASRGFEFHKDK